MKVAALLALFAVLPARAGDGVSPAQARTNVVKAMELPPELERGAKTGDLQRYLAGLSQDQKAAALRSLAAKNGELGNDPATLAIMGQAYAGLGKVKEARQAAQQALRVNEADQDARRVLLWADSQDRLAGREPGAAGGYSPSAAGAPAAPSGRQRGGWEGRVERLMAQRNRSGELDSVVKDASRDPASQNITMEQLNRAGIAVVKAPAAQERAVQLLEENGKYTVSIREDALNSSDARAAAHLGNGLRQAATDRDESGVLWAYIVAKGWITGGRIHKELAPTDTETHPKGSSDADVMTMRRLLDLAERRYDAAKEDLGAKYGAMMNIMNVYATQAPQALYERFIRSTKLDEPRPAGRN